MSDGRLTQVRDGCGGELGDDAVGAELGDVAGDFHDRVGEEVEGDGGELVPEDGDEDGEVGRLHLGHHVEGRDEEAAGTGDDRGPRKVDGVCDSLDGFHRGRRRVSNRLLHAEDSLVRGSRVPEFGQHGAVVGLDHHLLGEARVGQRRADLTHDVQTLLRCEVRSILRAGSHSLATF